MTRRVRRERRLELNSKNFPSEKWFIKQLEAAKITNWPERNFPLLNCYFGDFVWLREKLVVEIDGSSHAGKEEYDSKRDARIIKDGFRVVRIKFPDEVGAVSKFIEENIKMLTRVQRGSSKVVKAKKGFVSETVTIREKAEAANQRAVVDLQRRREQFQADLKRRRRGREKCPPSPLNSKACRP